MYFNSPIKYTITGKYMKIKFSTVTYFNKLIESKTLQFTKYSIDLNCGKQQIYCFGPGLNFNVKYLQKHKNLMWLYLMIKWGGINAFNLTQWI